MTRTIRLLAALATAIAALTMAPAAAAAAPPVRINHDDVGCVVAGLQSPERAPDQAFRPRVVSRKLDCDPTRHVAFGLGRLLKPVKVGVALGPTGGALTASAAAALEANMTLTGFSSDGVVVGSTGSAPSRSGDTARNGGKAGEISKLALYGGLAAGGVAVAAVAGGGGSGGSSGSGGSGSGSGGDAGAGAAGSVAGQWVGRADQGTGFVFRLAWRASCAPNART